jgi:hypothetical protein
MLKASTLVVAAVLLLASLAFGIEGQRRYDAAQQRRASHTVDVVGDSLAWQSATSIEAALERSGFTAAVSSNPGHSVATPWARQQLDVDLRDATAGAIVVETASNDAARLSEGTRSATVYEQLLDSLANAATNRCLVLVNAKESVTPGYYSATSASEVNAIIATVAASHPNVRVVDWRDAAADHGNWFGPDLLHFSPGLPAVLDDAHQATATEQTAGEKAFAMAITAGVQSCG